MTTGGMVMAKVWNKYANTAARQHGKPGREVRPKSVTIDCHCHVAVPRVAEIVGPHLKQATDPLVQSSTPETQTLMAKQAADIQSRISTTDERFGVMDEMGVDMQLICPSPPQIYYNLPLDVGVQAAHALNDGIAEYVGKHKDRLIALGGVPMQDGDEAAKELERCKNQLGFKGVEILTNVNGKELSDPAFAPFWKKAEELDALVLIHPTGFTQPQRFARFYFNNVIGNPLDTTMALHYLIFDGVLERHPKLKILAVHGGGYLGAYSGRIDHAWGARSDSHAGLPKPPTSYLKQIYVDTVVFTPHQLKALVDLFGADHVIMGTDYPFDMLEYDPIGHIASVDSFDDATRAKLAGGNLKKLVGL
jgi:aminocarboxymuconate-semialdehyde decarboxylase